MTVLRNRANWVAGWILAVGMLMMVALVSDPLNVQGDPVNDMGFGTFGLVVTGGAALFSWAMFRLFAVPSVFASAGILSVRNPIRQWAIPTHLIEGTDDSLTYLRVHACGHKILCLGLEKSNLALMVGNDKLDVLLERAIDAKQVIAAGGGSQLESGGAGRVSWTWVPIQRSEAIMAALWIMYFAVGAFQHFR